MSCRIIVRLLFLPALCQAVAPGELFDLSSWRLQLPQQSPSGGMTEVKQPELKTYHSEYFYTDLDESEQGIVFWAPSNGVLSAHGSGPRTELRENVEFKFSGLHKLSIVQQVLQVPPSGKVCIGQVKGISMKDKRMVANSSGTYSDITSTSAVGSGSCLIVVELIYSSPANELTAHMRDARCNDVPLKLGRYDLGEKIRISFEVEGFDVRVSTKKVKLPAYSYAFWKDHDYTMGFKVGDYVQGKGSSKHEGGKTRLSGITVSHSLLAPAFV